MSTIIVKTDDLREILRQVGNDNMKYVELSIEDDSEDESVCLNISATNDGYEMVEYDSIDEAVIE